MAKVSVIVPVYNAEKTLATSLGNLVNQTLSDIEIILVNDCSTDHSLDILMDCEAQFSDKVILVNSDTNHGAGGARNIGLSYASGEYIGFMDSDDIITMDMYEKLYNKALDGNYDIVDCGYYNEELDNAIVHTSDELAGELNDYKRSELIASGGYFWSRLFKHSFLDSVGLQFREHCILEDCETLMLLFATAKNIGNVKEILYCYKKNDASISKCIDATKFYNNATAAIAAIYNTLSPLPNFTGIQAAVEYSIYNLCALSANVCLTQGKTAPLFIQKERLTSIKNYVDSYIKLPVDRNKYIRNKINKEDLTLINNLEQIMHQL
ncbi:MAG: glycosyltransferase family 2 protein [Lachnospiraceae bacterium]